MGRRVTVDIDTGGTFTDGFFACGEDFEKVKVDTTPHDLTVCIANCIDEGSKKLGYDSMAKMLRDTEIIRYSTTVGTNALIQHTGPKLGLIVSKGYETTLYREPDGRPPVFDFVISPDMVIGITGEIGSNGEEVIQVDKEEIRAAVKQLLELGARIIAVSLLNSHLNPIHEKTVKETVEEDYPKHYLGSVPVLLGSETTSRGDNALRTNTALVNAYLHRDMVRYLYKAEDDLRKLEYGRPLLIDHATGGAARVAKTRAIDTYSSGPAAGVLGAAQLCRTFNLRKVVTLDIGGTSSDIALIIDGKNTYSLTPQIEGITVSSPAVNVLAIGAGGGSIARVAGGVLTVGPDSAGAMPGPVCYGFGGMEATATDACLALGYIAPDYFLGGRRKLDKGAALEAIQHQIAQPLGISLEEASLRIKQGIEANVARSISALLKQHGYVNPEEFCLFVYGGAGGLFCAGISQQLGVKRVYTFPFSAVFSAFGSASMDVLHIYEEYFRFRLGPGPGPDLEALNRVLAGMKQRAVRDMRGEGFAADHIAFSLELEVIAEGFEEAFMFTAPVSEIKGAQDIGLLYQAFVSASGAKEGEVVLLRLKATAPVAHYTMPKRRLGGTDPSPALKTIREVYWGGDGRQATPVYERERLEPGHVVAGPAIIEADDTTYVFPEGMVYVVDEYMSGIIERRAQS
ncbi:MAG: hydantoinase/oxoprolinase family protein [Clostridia bacterium]|nr:MAG: hydantoinase/oxoprolinase family protein [Clostridia bacterium]